MDSTDDGRVSVEELQMLLGEKDVLIYALRRQIIALQKRIAELGQKESAQ